jgi:hypothetical protein
MSMPLLELPVIAAALLLQPAHESPSPRPPCASRHAATVADCCVHLPDWEARKESPPRERPAQSPGKAEGGTEHGNS